MLLFPISKPSPFHNFTDQEILEKFFVLSCVYCNIQNLFIGILQISRSVKFCKYLGKKTLRESPLRKAARLRLYQRKARGRGFLSDICEMFQRLLMKILVYTREFWSLLKKIQVMIKHIPRLVFQWNGPFFRIHFIPNCFILYHWTKTTSKLNKRK